MAMNVTMPYEKFKQMDEKTLDIVRNAAEKKVDPTDRMILDDIGSRDHDNHELVLKACKEYKFEVPDKSTRSINKVKVVALDFASQAIKRALLKMGITTLKKFPQTKSGYGLEMLVATGMSILSESDRHITMLIAQQMARKDIKVEYRKPGLYKEEDMWRSGWYIYHGNEIAYHCSNPMLMRGTGGLIIIADARYFLIRTNAPEPKKGDKR